MKKDVVFLGHGLFPFEVFEGKGKGGGFIGSGLGGKEIGARGVGNCVFGDNLRYRIISLRSSYNKRSRSMRYKGGFILESRNWERRACGVGLVWAMGGDE